MSRTIKQLPKSKPTPDNYTLSCAPIGSWIQAVHIITDERVYGVVVGYTDGDPGVSLRRTDALGNKLLLMAIELDDDDYQMERVDDHAV